MSLATRCSACGTVFRVVKDQLLVSDGWVRCGRCQQVFNALEGLFDLERDGAPPPRLVNPPSPAVQRVLEELSRHGQGAATAASAPAASTDAHGGGPPVPDAASLAWPSAGPSSAAALATPAAGPTPAGLPDSPPDAGTDGVVMAPSLAAAMEGTHRLSASPGSSGPQVTVPDPAEALAQAAPPAHDGVADGLLRPSPAEPAPVIAADERPPRFVEAADRAAYWRQSGVRATLAGMAAVLALGLAAQSAWYWRDTIAARWPEARPWLEAACAPLHCQVQPLARIEHLSVDGSALTRIEGTALHRLGVTLRNRSDLALRAPAIELTLTDVAGSVLARRVLTLSDFGSPVVRLDAGQELALVTTLSMAANGERRLGGYTVELFYP